jgi:hypothetical protein
LTFILIILYLLMKLVMLCFYWLYRLTLYLFHFVFLLYILLFYLYIFLLYLIGLLHLAPICLSHGLFLLHKFYFLFKLFLSEFVYLYYDSFYQIYLAFTPYHQHYDHCSTEYKDRYNCKYMVLFSWLLYLENKDIFC